MIKVKFIAFGALIFFANYSWGVYVSPIEYKKYTCEDLQEEYMGWWEEDANLDSEYYDAIIESKRLSKKWQDNKDNVAARIKAINIAAKKISCVVKKKKAQ